MSSELEILAVTLMDIRATIESMRRSITNAQSSVEQFRHTADLAQMKDIADCLDQLRKECALVTQSTTEADDSIRAITATGGAA